VPLEVILGELPENLSGSQRGKAHGGVEIPEKREKQKEDQMGVYNESVMDRDILEVLENWHTLKQILRVTRE